MVLSGYTDLDSVTDAINQGAIYRFLTKPWDDNLLRAHIVEAFRRYAAMQEDQRELKKTAAALAQLTAENRLLKARLSGGGGMSTLVEPLAPQEKSS
jgi:FixJ family two-component response regulator